MFPFACACGTAQAGREDDIKVAETEKEYRFDNTTLPDFCNAGEIGWAGKSKTNGPVTGKTLHGTVVYTETYSPRQVGSSAGHPLELKASLLTSAG